MNSRHQPPGALEAGFVFRAKVLAQQALFGFHARNEGTSSSAPNTQRLARFSRMPGLVLPLVNGVTDRLR